MIKREYGKISMVCDSCGDEMGQFDKEDYDIMIIDARANGYVTQRNDSGGWENLCPHCADADRRTKLRKGA